MWNPGWVSLGYSPFTPWKETAGIVFFENSGQENRTSKSGIHEAPHEGLDFWEGRAGPVTQEGVR